MWGRRLLGVGVIGAGIAAAVVRRHQLGQAFGLIGNARWVWLGAAIGFEVASLVAFARLQWWLLRAGGVRLRLRTISEITLAGNALAMSLPGGTAWSAAWAFSQLRRRGAPGVLAGWVVLMAGALASFALFLLLVAGSLISGHDGPAAGFRPFGLALLAIPVVAAGLWALSRRSPRVRSALGRAGGRIAATRVGGALRGPAKRLVSQIGTVRPTRLQWVEAFGLALVNWLTTCACLIASIIAVGGHVPWRGILVAYTLAQVAASLPITPGGLGVVEGSLTALLVAYGLHTDVALAAVLLFRAVSFWGLVPIGWGAWAALTFAGRGRPGRARHPWGTDTAPDGAAGPGTPADAGVVTTDGSPAATPTDGRC